MSACVALLTEWEGSTQLSRVRGKSVYLSIEQIHPSALSIASLRPGLYRYRRVTRLLLFITVVALVFLGLSLIAQDAG